MLAQLLEHLRQSLWFIPAVFVLAAAMLSIGLVAVDRANADLGRAFPLLFGGGPDGARGMLSAIAGSMITVAGVTFSITIVALALTSSQFSPRALRQFMRDRPNQVVLGVFMATFTYAVLVLRTVRAAEPDGTCSFVPNLAVTVGIGLALASLGMLVYFIHHIATRIQVSSIVASIAAEAMTTIHASPEAHRGDWDGTDVELPQGTRGTVHARESGYLQYVDLDAVVEHARNADALVEVCTMPGSWVQASTPIFTVWPPEAADSTLGEALFGALHLGDQRSMRQDVAFGIQQLVDIGLKALSPGINDPTTASNCADRLVQILVALGQAGPPRRDRRDEDGTLRLVLPALDWEGIVRLAFDQLRHYAAGVPTTSISLILALATVGRGVPSRLHPPLEAQVRLIAQAAVQIDIEDDRYRVNQAAEAALASLVSAPASP